MAVLGQLFGNGILGECGLRDGDSPCDPCVSNEAWGWFVWQVSYTVHIWAYVPVIITLCARNAGMQTMRWAVGTAIIGTAITTLLWWGEYEGIVKTRHQTTCQALTWGPSFLSSIWGDDFLNGWLFMFPWLLCGFSVLGLLIILAWVHGSTLLGGWQPRQPYLALALLANLQAMLFIELYSVQIYGYLGTGAPSFLLIL